MEVTRSETRAMALYAFIATSSCMSLAFALGCLFPH